MSRPEAEHRDGLEIVDLETFDQDHLISRIRQTPLRGFDQPQIYAEAEITLMRAVDPEDLSPAQAYVLRDGVSRSLTLRTALAAHGLDLFDLAGGAWIRTRQDPDRRIPVLPPVVERSIEPDGRSLLIVSDGLHRVYAARSIGAAITVLAVDGVPADYPYYAYPMAGGWSDVAEVDALVDGLQKKNYRQPHQYKALFRDYGAVFPGVQTQRKRTNPSHLTA